MATKDGVVETEEVMVTGNLITTREFDRVRRAVCLLKSATAGEQGNSWNASGFYVKVKLKQKNNVSSIHCIMTNYHVFQAKENTGSEMVAVFNHEGSGENSCEVRLEPFRLLASNKDLDYALIRLEEKAMKSLDILPILAAPRENPAINDTVYIIQHPGGREKHFSTDQIKDVVPPFIEYYADTSKGSSGSPVFVVVDTVLVLIALHCKGMVLPGHHWNKGVLISEILRHLQTGKYTLPVTGIPGQLESAVQVPVLVKGSKNPSDAVTRGDVMRIAVDISKVWKKLGRVLEVSESDLDIIEINYSNDVYEMSFQMLTKWMQTKVSQANYGALAAGFSHPSVGKEILISKYC